MKCRIALETKVLHLLKKNFIVTDSSTLNSVTVIKHSTHNSPGEGGLIWLALLGPNSSWKELKARN